MEIGNPCPNKPHACIQLFMLTHFITITKSIINFSLNIKQLVNTYSTNQTTPIDPFMEKSYGSLFENNLQRQVLSELIY
jgi:hypothetical protein